MQVFFFKNIGYYDVVVPHVYILFILLLPFSTPNWLLFSLAFLTGLTIDVFNGTLGINAAASTVLAFLRILFMKFTLHREGFESGTAPSWSAMGFRWSFYYTSLTAFIHHTVLIFLEAFKVSDFFYNLRCIVLSTLFTTMLLLLFQLCFSTKRKR